MGAAAAPGQRAALAERVAFAPDLTYFLPCTLRVDAAGRSWAHPAPVNTSGDFATLAGADGLVELEAGREEFPAGYTAPYYPWMC